MEWERDGMWKQNKKKAVQFWFPYCRMDIMLAILSARKGESWRREWNEVMT